MNGVMSDECTRLPAPPGPLYGVRLRRWRADDEGDLAAVLAGVDDAEFRRWNTPLTAIEGRAGAERYLRRRVETWAKGEAASFCVTDEDSGAPLGQVGLQSINWALSRASVGYWVLPEARGRGVATRALDAMARWAVTDVGLHRLELGHAVGHGASCTVAERCGFRYEGTTRGSMFEAGRYDAFRDAHLHARLATDEVPAPV